MNRRLFKEWGQAALIAAAIGYAYFPALRGRWLWDDGLYITLNPALRSLAGLRSIWIAPIGVNYFPITATVQWCQWHLWHDRTLGYHLTNVGLHFLSACLVWRLLRQLGLRHGWLGGLLFAVHPLCVESVAWISEIKNALSLPPLLIAACAYVAFEAAVPADNRNPAAPFHRDRRYLLSLACFTIALLCKSTTVAFPAFILLFAWWRRGRISRPALMSALPFFVVAIGLGLVTVWFEGHRSIGAADTTGPHLAARLAVAAIAPVFYLAKCVFPWGLITIYPQWKVDPPTAVEFLPLLAFAGFVVWLWRRQPSSRGSLFGLGWFWGNLLPVLGLVPMAYQIFSWVADRFAYYSLVGLIGLAVAGWESAGGGAVRTDGAEGGRRGLLLTGAIGLVVVVFTALSHGLAENYVSERALWSHTLAEYPDAWPAHDYLGNALDAAGDRPGAMAEYRTSLRLRPNSGDTNYNLGVDLSESGRSEEALPYLRKAAGIEPDPADSEFQLGMAYSHLGRMPEAIAQYRAALRDRPIFPEARGNLGMLLAGSHRLAEAVEEYREAIRQNPGLPEVHNNLGAALLDLGRPAEAIGEFEAALRIAPRYAAARLNLARAHFNLGAAAASAGRPGEAIGDYLAAVRLIPASFQARFNLAAALADAGRLAEAGGQYAEALRLQPKSAEAHNNLGAVLIRTGQLPEAIQHLQRAVELRPAYAEAHNNLGVALANAGRNPEAVAEFRRAVALKPDFADARRNLDSVLRK